MKKLLLTTLSALLCLAAWAQVDLSQLTPITTADGLDLTGNTYYVLRFVGSSYVQAEGLTVSASGTVRADDSDVFCIEPITPAPTGDNANYKYRLRNKEGKYMGYNDAANKATVCLYDQVQNEYSTTVKQQTIPVMFNNGNNSGILVERKGNAYKYINLVGTGLEFKNGSNNGAAANIVFYKADEVRDLLPEPEEPEVLDYTAPVFIFAGQSNMDGRAAVSGYPQYMQDYVEHGAEYCRWSYANGSTTAWSMFGGRFAPYRPYTDNNQLSRTGFDGVVYHYIEEALQKPFYVIKESLGGTAIDPRCTSTGNRWWCADADWLLAHEPRVDGGSLAKELTENIGLCIDNVLSQLQNGYDIKGIVWHQGCSDRTQPQAYKENLRTLVNYLRNYIAVKTGNPKYLKLPFICCNINPNSTQYDATIDQAKHELAQEMENFYEVSFADCSLGSDNLHHDAAGNIKGAERVFAMMEQLGMISTDVWQAGNEPTPDPNPDPNYNDDTHVVSVNINAGWHFLKRNVAQNTLDTQTGWQEVNLPHTWNALDGQDGGNNYHRGACWYRKTIHIPSEAVGRTAYLNFGAANMTTTVYIDGQQVGTHTGGYARFMFDITRYIAGKSEATLDIKVDNSASIMSPPLGGDFTFFGGITRDLTLDLLPTVQIAPLNVVNTEYLTTPIQVASSGVTIQQSNVSATSAKLDIKVNLANKTASAAQRTLVVTVYEANGTVKTTDQSIVSIAANTATTTNFTLSIPNPHLWNGKRDPYLYRVQVSLLNGDEVEHTVVQPLGLRFFEISKTEGFKLNGVSYPLRGIAIHDAVNDKGRAVSDADRKRDIDLMLETGANYLRLSHYQHGDFTYNYLDSLGIICWTEIPVVEQTAPNATAAGEFLQNCSSQLYELIRQCENHPSVICWGVANEIRQAAGVNQVPTVRHLHNIVKSEDDRPSALAHNGWYEECAVTDLVSFNIYQGWYGGAYTGFGGAFDGYNSRTNHPVGVSEYGAGGNIHQHEYPASKPTTTGAWHPEEYMNAYHESHLQQINARPQMWQSSIWVGIDFASDHRAEGDQPGINDKGLVTYDRQVRKDVFYLYKAAWNNDETTLYITSRRYTEREGTTFPVRVYTNCASATLYVNDQLVGTANTANNVAEWPNVQAQAGANCIVVKGVRNGVEVTDEVVWNCVESTNPTDMFAGEIQINFATAGTAVEGYLLDKGEQYGDREGGYSYGWEVDMTGQTRNRTSYTTDARLATFVQMQPNTEPVGNHTWKISLPNGHYRVGIAVGDNDYTDSHHVIEANGVEVVNFTPSGKKFGAGSAEVEVTDGQLVITPATTSTNAKINFIHIHDMALDAVANERRQFFERVEPAEGSTVPALETIVITYTNQSLSSIDHAFYIVDADGNEFPEMMPEVDTDARTLTLHPNITDEGTYTLVVPAQAIRLAGVANTYEHRFTFYVGVSYATNFDGMNSTHGSRATTGIRLVSPTYGTQTIAINQGVGGRLVWDLTASATPFECDPNEQLTVSGTNTIGWMNYYVYVDENSDGFFASDDDIVNNTLQLSSDIDLRTYSNYGGYNSLGVSNNDNNAQTMPPFAAPSAPGNYRMRFKVDWNNIDPRGNNSADNTLQANGGIIADVTLHVNGSIDDAIAITTANAAAMCYDLQGRHVATPKHGVYIINGVKTVVNF